MGLKLSMKMQARQVIWHRMLCWANMQQIYLRILSLPNLDTIISQNTLLIEAQIQNQTFFTSRQSRPSWQVSMIFKKTTNMARDPKLKYSAKVSTNQTWISTRFSRDTFSKLKNYDRARKQMGILREALLMILSLMGLDGPVKIIPFQEGATLRKFHRSTTEIVE